MLSTATDAGLAFLSSPHITSDSFNAGALVSSDTLLNALVYRIFQLDPTQQAVASVAPTNIIGSGPAASYTVPITITAGLYFGASQMTFQGDTFFLLNTNIKNFKIQGCVNYPNGGSPTWTTIYDASSGVGNVAADLIIPLVSSVQYNGILLTIYSTQDGNPAALSVFNCALFNYQVSKPAVSYRPSQRQNRRDIVLADGTIDATGLYWSDNSFVLVEPELSFDLMPVADKIGVEGALFGRDAFLVFLEPDRNPEELYLCLLKPGSYSGAEYSSQYKGAGYKFSFTLQQVGYR